LRAIIAAAKRTTMPAMISSTGAIQFTCEVPSRLSKFDCWAPTAGIRSSLK